jgi:hypothetical protein
VSCLGLDEEELEALISCTDINRNGEIDWGEFVVATMDPAKLAEEENIHQVFQVNGPEGLLGRTCSIGTLMQLLDHVRWPFICERAEFNEVCK